MAPQRLSSGSESPQLGSWQRSAKRAREILHKSFSETEWRTVTWPGCPACGLPAQQAGCGRQAWWMPPLPNMIVGKMLPAWLRCLGEWRLDVDTGVIHCKRCGMSDPFADTQFLCPECGAMFEGGEMWEGMSADVTGTGRRPWMQSLKSRNGQEILGCMAGARRLAKVGRKPRCGCNASLYRIDGAQDVCAKCLQRWPV